MIHNHVQCHELCVTSLCGDASRGGTLWHKYLCIIPFRQSYSKCILVIVIHEKPRWHVASLIVDSDGTIHCQ